jgi:hypothetical protein
MAGLAGRIDFGEACFVQQGKVPSGRTGDGLQFLLAGHEGKPESWKAVLEVFAVGHEREEKGVNLD